MRGAAKENRHKKNRKERKLRQLCLPFIINISWSARAIEFGLPKPVSCKILIINLAQSIICLSCHTFKISDEMNRFFRSNYMVEKSPAVIFVYDGFPMMSLIILFILNMFQCITKFAYKIVRRK